MRCYSYLRLRVGKLILGILVINSFYWNKLIKYKDLEFQKSTFSTGLFRRFFQFHFFKIVNRVVFVFDSKETVNRFLFLYLL